MNAATARDSAAPVSNETCPSARTELIRAVGAICLDPPPASNGVCDAVGLDRINGVDHTEAFVLQAPPHSAIHLSTGGTLGGDAVDRVEGFWRALGLTAPDDADHLGVLLIGYAHLRAIDGERARHAAQVLFDEHVWSWAPGYLHALAGSVGPHVAAWSELTLEVLAGEAERLAPPAQAPLALREAPEPVNVDSDLNEVLDAMVAPVRCGVVLTQYNVACAARALGLGFRRGERRFALKAMMEQDKAATLGWFGSLATHVSGQHLHTYGEGPTGRWWSARAADTAAAFADLARRAG